MLCKHCNEELKGAITDIKVTYFPEEIVKYFHASWYQPCWYLAKGITKPVLNYFMLREGGVA